jgi:HSP20 family protein
MSNHEEDNEGLPNDLARGINGIFRGLTSLVNAAAKLTESTDAVEIARNGSFGVHDGVQAAYGITVGPGPQRPAARPVRSFRRPVARPPRSFRRQTESAPPAEELWEPVTDVFDEGDHYLVVAELSGFDESAIHWKVIGNALLIDGFCDNRVCHKKLILSSAVKDENITSSFNNGILELRLWKQ